MNFGRIDPAELDQVDFALPPDPAVNKTILTGRPASSPKVLLGCPTWGSKKWIGKLYPPKTKEKQFAEYYPGHFNSIELNATHYKIYDRDFVLNWKAKAAGHDFIFCPKMYNGITHDGHLNDKAALVQQYMQSIAYLQPHLGPVFIQLSDSFGGGRKMELFNFLERLPKHQQFFLEVRHFDWYNNPDIKKELFNHLRQLHIGAVITDAPGRRDCVHLELPIPKTFIRYVGNNLHASDWTRADDWAQRIKHWLDNGMEEIYFFSHMPEEEYCPEMLAYLAGKLNGSCGLNLPIPKLRENSAGKIVQGSMFD